MIKKIFKKLFEKELIKFNYYLLNKSLEYELKALGNSKENKFLLHGKEVGVCDARYEFCKIFNIEY
jgi:hypothetical protein